DRRHEIDDGAGQEDLQQRPGEQRKDNAPDSWPQKHLKQGLDVGIGNRGELPIGEHGDQQRAEDVQEDDCEGLCYDKTEVCEDQNNGGKKREQRNDSSRHIRSESEHRTQTRELRLNLLKEGLEAI